MNAIYRSGDVVLRVSEPSAPAVASIELAEMLLDRGLAVTRPMRTDVVESKGLSATAWEYVPKSNSAIDWQSVGKLVRRTHDIAASDLPVAYPLPRPATSRGGTSLRCSTMLLRNSTNRRERESSQPFTGGRTGPMTLIRFSVMVTFTQAT